MPLDYIVKVGELATEMFFIKSGTVHVCINNKVLATLKLGQYFGEKSLIGRSYRKCDVSAISFCVVSLLNKCDIEKLYDD